MPQHEDRDIARDESVRSQLPAHRHVKRLLSAFPSDQAAALELIESDANFRRIAEEYEACNEAIERLAHTKFDADLRTEYAALRLEIEGQLLHRVLDYESKRGSC